MHARVWGSNVSEVKNLEDCEELLPKDAHTKITVDCREKRGKGGVALPQVKSSDGEAKNKGEYLKGYEEEKRRRMVVIWEEMEEKRRSSAVEEWLLIPGVHSGRRVRSKEGKREWVGLST